jgi:Rrf2 family protein
MAMISLTAEYALRAVLHLAALGEEQPCHTVGQIAAGTQVPPDYLSKVLQSLARAGLIASRRGMGGGFRLVKPPDELSIYEVIQAVDPIERIRTCPLGLEAHGTTLCQLHRRLDDAVALIENQFRGTTVAELLEKPALARKPAPNGHCAFPLEVGHAS